MEAIEVTHGTRTFVYKGRNLTDPDPAMTAKEVIDFYSMQYPEMATADYVRTQQVDGSLKYEVQAKMGTKG